MNNVFTKTSGLLVSLILIWGFSWSIYKAALIYTPPLLFAGIRSLLGGLLLAVCLLPIWRKLKWRETWRLYAVSALLNAVLFYGLQTVGLNYLPGGLFSVIVYLQPVLVGLFAWLWLGETMTLLKIIGLLIGFSGIAVISSDSFTGALSVAGIVIALLAAVSWALGVVFVKKVSREVNSMWMVAMQSIIGGGLLTVIGSGAESWSAITWNGTFVASLLFGATLGIPIAFLIYFHLINNGEASKVASFTFLVPLLAVAVGSFFMNEPVTYTLGAGLVLVVLSIVIVNYRPKKRAVLPDKAADAS